MNSKSFEVLLSAFYKMSPASKKEELLMGRVWLDEGWLIFRLPYLSIFLSNRGMEMPVKDLITLIESMTYKRYHTAFGNIQAQLWGIKLSGIVAASESRAAAKMAGYVVIKALRGGTTPGAFALEIEVNGVAYSFDCNRRELLNYQYFRELLIERAHYVVPLVKQSVWDDMLNDAFSQHFIQQAIGVDNE